MSLRFQQLLITLHEDTVSNCDINNCLKSAHTYLGLTHILFVGESDGLKCLILQRNMQLLHSVCTCICIFVHDEVRKQPLGEKRDKTAFPTVFWDVRAQFASVGDTMQTGRWRKARRNFWYVLRVREITINVYSLGY